MTNGDLLVTDNVTAGRSLNVETRGQGDIGMATDVTVNQDMTMKTQKGNIDVGQTITANNGSVSMTTTDTGNINVGKDVTAGVDVNMNVNSGNVSVGADVNAGNNVNMDVKSGNIQVGKDGKGSVVANNNVNMAVGTGNVSVDKAVKAKTGSVDVHVTKGDIQIGSNKNDDTVWAKQNVSLVTDSGKIRINGKTTTETGDITVHAANDTYVEGAEGIIFDQDGQIAAGRDANLIMTRGDLVVSGRVTAGRNLNAQTVESGNISLGDDVTVNNNLNMTTDTGNITVGKTINAQNGSVSMTTNVKGDITVGASVKAGQDVDMTVKKGDITVGANVEAGQDVSMTVDDGDVNVVKAVRANNGSVDILTKAGNIKIGDNEDEDTLWAKQDVNLESHNGKIEINGKTTTQTGDVNITVVNDTYNTDESIVFAQNGKIAAGHDANLTVENGDLRITNDVSAKNSFNARTRNRGNIELGENITVTKDMSMQTDTGNITVGKTITADKGSVSMTTQTGNVSVGKEDGTGNIKAKEDVTIDVQKKGDITVKTSIVSTDGSVAVRTKDGKINIGYNKDKDTIYAKQNVDLAVESGTITVNGTTRTEEGDITVVALNKDDTQNIVITENGKLLSGRDLTLHTYNGGIKVTDNTVAKRNLIIQVDNQGDVEFAHNIDVNGSVKAQIANGTIRVGEDITAGQDVELAVGTGGDDGAIIIGGTNGNGNVKARNGNVKLTADDGDIKVVKTVKSDGGNVEIVTGRGDITIGSNGKDVDTVYAKQDVTLATQNGQIKIYGKTRTETGDVTVYAANRMLNSVLGASGQNILFDQQGEIESGRDANLIVENGDLHVTDHVRAKGSFNAETRGKGNISLDDNITVWKDMSMKTETGNITVGKTITAEDGSVSMTTGTGDIKVKKDIVAGENVNMTVGTGDIKVGTGTDGDVLARRGNVTIRVDEGNVEIVKTVEATKGDVDILTKKGNIKIGNNGRYTKTVTAGQDVKLETQNGEIRVQGKTQAGRDASLAAASEDYTAGEAGHNIIIEQDGMIEAGRDAKLETTKGDIHVTDRIVAGNGISAITHGQGNIFLDRDVAANPDGGSVILRAEDKGDITASIDPATNNRYKITAGDLIDVFTGDGSITIGEAEAARMSLIARGEDNSVTADKLLLHANGAWDVTGAANLTLGGSHVNVTRIENDGTAPLIISTVGGAADNRPIQDFNIGVRTGNGTYTGGIQSASGAVIQQLWADRGMIYMAGGTNLHISKLSVNEKLHVANDIVSVGIFGVPPYHDGARVVYWNDVEKNNPAGMLNRWYSGSYIDSAWMYLDLGASGAVGSRYGVLMDAHGYRNLYGDSVSVVDTMRRRMEYLPSIPDIAHYDRGGLIQIDEDEEKEDAKSGEITVE